MAKSNPRIILAIGAAVASAIAFTLLLSGGGKKGSGGGGQSPSPSPDPQNPPGADLAAKYPGLVMIDMRDQAPKDQVDHIRGLEKTTGAVLHQTGFFNWKDDNPLWPKVKAHFVVRKDGRVQINYNPEVRMTTGSGVANSFAVSIEHEGNFVNANGNAFMPEKYGVSHPSDAQIAASRKLLAALKAMNPNFTGVFAHRQFSGIDRSNCPGPEIWRGVGEWAKQNLGMQDGGPGWKYGDGLPIPDSWRVPLVA